jgi:hypothetical protein
MEFFKKFRELYNYSKSIENTEEFYSFVDDKAWMEFQNKIKNYSLETFEVLYRVILHYHYIETKKLNDFPYKLKIYNGIEGKVGNGITFEPKNLPLCLQYMLLNW